MRLAALGGPAVWSTTFFLSSDILPLFSHRHPSSSSLQSSTPFLSVSLPLSIHHLQSTLPYCSTGHPGPLHCCHCLSSLFLVHLLSPQSLPFPALPTLLIPRLHFIFLDTSSTLCRSAELPLRLG